MDLRALVGALAAMGLAACGGEPPPAQGPIETNATPPPVEETADEPTTTLMAALTDFGNCMSMEVFVTTGIYKLYKDVADIGDNTNQQCGSCHANGEGGAFISEDVLAMFKGNKQFPGIMRIVTGTVDEQGNFETLVPSNRFIDKGVEPCLPDELCHPRFNLPAEMQKAVLTFTEVSLERWAEDKCSAPYQAEEE